MLRFQGDLQPVMPDGRRTRPTCSSARGKTAHRLVPPPPSPLIMARRTMESAMRSPASTKTPDFDRGVGVYIEEGDDRHVEIVFPERTVPNHSTSSGYGTIMTGTLWRRSAVRHARWNEYRPKPHERAEST